jgi:broad specificity phosphatase PhoE
LIRIYLARHGETTWNAEGRIQGRSDPELSPKGYAQSQGLLEQLKERPISAVYTSTLQRSILTARPIANYFGLPIQRQPELDEIAFGILEGKHILDFSEELKEEWERFKDKRLTYRISGGENYADVTFRVKPFMEKILSKHEGQEILIVGHRVVNRLLIGMLMDYPLEMVLKIEQTNGCVYLVEKNGEAKISYFIDGEVREGFVPVTREVAS